MSSKDFIFIVEVGLYEDKEVKLATNNKEKAVKAAYNTENGTIQAWHKDKLILEYGIMSNDKINVWNLVQDREYTYDDVLEEYNDKFWNYVDENKLKDKF